MGQRHRHARGAGLLPDPVAIRLPHLRPILLLFRRRLIIDEKGILGKLYGDPAGARLAAHGLATPLLWINIVENPTPREDNG